MPPEFRPPAGKEQTPLWKKPFVWLSTAVAVAALLLSQTTSILTNARNLPSEWQKTSDQFSSWYWEYPAWGGLWTNNPEGSMDAPSMKLAAEDFQLQLDVGRDGSLTGTIQSNGICDKVPFFEELQVEGSIESSTRSVVTVFDFVGGERARFAELELTRDGEVMSVRAQIDPFSAFTSEYRIARDPENGMNPAADREQVCRHKSERLIDEAIKSATKKTSNKTGPQ